MSLDLHDRFRLAIQAMRAAREQAEATLPGLPPERHVDEWLALAWGPLSRADAVTAAAAERPPAARGSLHALAEELEVERKGLREALRRAIEGGPAGG